MEKQDLTGMELQRTGRRGGCSCCSFTLLGFLSVPVAAIVTLFTVF